jgi:arabinose-5-phosphate isomerase
MTDKIREIFNKEASAINNIPVTSSYEEAINIIHRQVHVKNGKLVTSGMGKAGQIAHNIATTFSSTGTPAAFLHPSEAQHGDLGILQKNDVLLAISNSGKTREIIELIELKNNLYAEVPVIVITSNPESPLAQKADCYILTGAPKEVCILGLTPTTSTTVMTVIGDALVVLLMEKIGFNAKDYAKRHHGGYLGMKSREISEEDKRQKEKDKRKKEKVKSKK